MTRRAWIVVGVVGVAAVAIVLAFVLRGSLGGDAGRSETLVDGALVTSPYDFAEAGEEIDRALVREAKFVSITLCDAGTLKSFMVSAGQPAFEHVAEDVAVAKRVDAAEPSGSDSSVTFVLHDRRTITFILDEDNGLLARGGVVYGLGEGYREHLEQAIGQAERSGDS